MSPQGGAGPTGGGGDALGWLDAVVLGLVEGLTEFLPVSSTGHLIVAQRALGLPAGAAENAFAVGIQMGAITAILVLYWRRLWDALRTILRPVEGRRNLLLQIAVAAFPAALLGLLCDDWIDRHLFSTRVVAATLLIGGVLLLWLERWLAGREPNLAGLPAMSYRAALAIGLWQCLALVPGTSRAGATIGGALLLGLSRTAAAEFSFLVGLPILYGASVYKLVAARDALTAEMWQPLAIGTVVSFVAALAVVQPFVTFVRRHSFAPFAWYRIVAGAVLFVLLAVGWLE